MSHEYYAFQYSSDTDCVCESCILVVVGIRGELWRDANRNPKIIKIYVFRSEYIGIMPLCDDVFCVITIIMRAWNISAPLLATLVSSYNHQREKCQIIWAWRAVRLRCKLRESKFSVNGPEGTATHWGRSCSGRQCSSWHRHHHITARQSPQSRKQMDGCFRWTLWSWLSVLYPDR